MSRLSVILLALLLSLPATAELNKWTDEHGNVIYSDLPPPASFKAETLRSSPTPAAPAESKPEAANNNAETAKQARSRAAVEAENRKIAQANCAAAQQNLRTLQSGMRMAEVNEAGEMIYLDDAQREQRIAKAKQDIAEWCQ
jgi:hypothetical protein